MGYDGGMEDDLPWDDCKVAFGFNGDSERLFRLSGRKRSPFPTGWKLTGVDSTGALSEFERMEDKVEEEEARAKAYAELDTDSLDEQFKNLEHADAVDKELAELKARRGGGS